MESIGGAIAALAVRIGDVYRGAGSWQGPWRMLIPGSLVEKFTDESGERMVQGIARASSARGISFHSVPNCPEAVVHIHGGLEHCADAAFAIA